DASGSSTGGTASNGTCRAVGDTCQSGTECCSGVCDPASGCVSTTTTCAASGDACKVGTDCCSLSCVGEKCSAAQCVSDGAACASDDSCCSGTCGADKTCTPLNDSCKTAGNTCAGNADCCSGLCDASKHCALGSSFCIQPGDTCARDGDCCTANCVIAAAHSVGTCAPPPTGPAYCTKVDGMLCSGCGDCCSRLCAPGPSGVSICQPASGCHVTGDLCRKDSDCCGGDPNSGLPGAGNGSCHLDASGKIGICTNPVNGGDTACDPEGNVCHYLADQNYACTSSSARSDCCGPLNPKAQMCQLDALGVPRCLGVGTCHAAGDVCASAADCCDNKPCVPDDMGALHCLTAACVPTGGSCTINGDCCPGGLCNRPPGSTVGSCATTGGGGTGGTGSGGSPSTGGSSAGGSPGACAEYGQICTVASDCCNGVPCTSGICTEPVVK
ncbi:MAG TPA: hypothetical protein VK745_05715, partial [Polyangiaceae bacterium]|nr:hypothetical protein [Polyangiaceae bacterium]